MTSKNPELSEGTNVLKTSSESEKTPDNQPPRKSATTQDEPAFGWSGYAERVNGRFAMIGFIALLFIEALSRESFLQWVGLFH